MTRISGAQVRPSLPIDQIGTQTGAIKGNGDAAAFDSHLTRFSQNANEEQIAEDTGSTSSTSGQGESAALGKQQPDSVSAMFAALSEDAQEKTTATGSTTVATAGSATGSLMDIAGGSPAFRSQLMRANNAIAGPRSANPSAEAGGSSEKEASNSVASLLAALNSDERGSLEQTPGSAISGSETELNPSSNSNMTDKAQSVAQTTPLVPVPSPVTDSATASLPASQIQNTASRDGASAKASSQALGSSKPGAHSWGAPAAKTSAQSTNAPVDLSSTAQAAAITTIALPAQNAVPAQASRKLTGATGADSKSSQAPARLTNTASGQTSAVDTLSGVQSTSGILASSSDDSLNLSLDSSEANDGSTQTINMKASSIQAQTHFAPVQHLSPTAQIADFVVAAAGNLTSGTSEDSSAAPAATASIPSADTSALSLSQPSTSMIKTLTLSLEPDSLGTVTVTMRLGDSGLDLQLEAAKSETTSLIEKDKANLSDKLQSSGYTVDSLVVKTASQAQGTNQDPSGDQSAAGQGQQAANDAPASGMPQNGGHNANDQSPSQGGRGAVAPLNPESSSDPSAARSIGDGIYV